jgi:hypothetical protein
MGDIAIFARSQVAGAIGAAVALRMVRSGPVGLVLLGEPTERRPFVPMPPPTPAAVRVSSALRAMGHPATAGWRLIRSDVTSVNEARLILDQLAEAGVRATLAVAIARDDEVDELAERCSIRAVADDTEPGHSVILAAAEADPTLAQLRLTPAGASIVLAHSGIGSPPAWVEPIDALMDAAASLSQGAVRGLGGSP